MFPGSASLFGMPGSSVPSPRCRPCGSAIEGEVAELACGHRFHIQCALEHFISLNSEDRRLCPTCNFQVKSFSHGYIANEKPLSDLGKEILCESRNPDFVPPAADKAYQGETIALSIQLCFSPEKGPQPTDRVVSWSVDSLSTVQELRNELAKEYRSVFFPRFDIVFNGKKLRNKGKILEDCGLKSGSTLVLAFPKPLED